MNTTKSKLILGFSVLALTACGSTGGVKSTSKFDKAKYVSTRTTKKLSKATCPASAKSFNKQHRKQLLELGNACVQAKKWPMLEKIGSRLAKIDHSSPWGAYFLSIGSQGQGNHTRALWMADLALKKSPKLGFLHYQKGRVLWGMGEYETSVKSMNDALKYDKTLTDAHLFLGQIYYRDRDVKKAAKHFKGVLKTEPSNLAALIGVAESYYQAKDNKDAIVYFEKAVDQAPSNLEIRFRLADVYEKENQYGEALTTYRRIKRLMRSNKRKRSTTGVNVAEKIEALEAMVAEQSPGRKVTRSEASERRAK